MRQVSMNVYSFEELSDQAKQYAFEKFCYEHEYPFYYENEKTFEAIESVCDVVIYNWEYDMYSHHFKLSLKDMELMNLHGDELKNYLIENFGDYMEDKKELTGYYLEWTFFGCMKKHLDKITNFTTYLDIIDICLEEVFEDIEHDIENHYSMENLRDLADINEWEFLENGDMY